MSKRGFLEMPSLDYEFKIGEKTDYGIGIIGTGWVANNYHLPPYKKAGFNVVAIADIKKEAVESTQQHWGIEKAFTDYRQLLELKEVEIVDVLTYRYSRAEIVKAAAAAGKHVMAQKPFAAGYEDAVAMVEACEQAGVKLGVHLHYRYMPSWRVARDLLRAGYIGEPFFIVDEMLGNQDVPYYEDPQRRWNTETDNFMYIEWGAHHFDFIRFWAERNPLTVYSLGTRMPGQHFKSEMACTSALEFEGPLRAILVFNQVTQGPEGYMRFRIEGTDGIIKGNGALGLEMYSRRLEEPWFRPELKADLPADSFIGTMGELMNAITYEREPENSGKDGINSVLMYLAAARSSVEKRPVSLDEIAGKVS